MRVHAVSISAQKEAGDEEGRHVQIKQLGKGAVRLYSREWWP